jgi:hypothetical protein
MQKVSLYDYYSFGFNYYFLLNTSETKSTEDFAKDVDNYNSFIRKLDLKVTTSLLRMSGWDDVMEELNKLNKGVKKKKPITKSLYDKIKEIIRKADATLDAELDIKNAFLIGEKRVNIENLTDNIYKLFANETFNCLPEIAIFDFSESGKCIAFDRHTASAFHSLRGTEDVLKFYYSLLTGKKATETQTWGYFHTEIENEIKKGEITPSPPRELMDNLNNLRVYYRNKTQHPNLIYNSDEAQDLLFNCIKCINQIIKDLKERKLIEDFLF